MYLSNSDVDKFWSKVDKLSENECWEWVGGKRGRCGIMKIGNKTVSAHRLSFFIHNKGIDDFLQVRHICDNPPCVNPNHLTQGSAKKNSDDKLHRNRHTYKFSNEEVLEMRSLPMTSTICRELSRIHNVSATSIRNMLTGQTYWWVDGAVQVPPQHTAHTLTPEQVSEILNRLESGKWGINRQLAKEYGVKEATICHIKKNRLKYSHTETK